MEFTVDNYERMLSIQHDGHRFDVLFGSAFRGFSTVVRPFDRQEIEATAFWPTIEAVGRIVARRLARKIEAAS